MKKKLSSSWVGIQTVHFDESDLPESNKIVPLGLYIHEDDISEEEITMTRELASLELTKKQNLS